MRHSHLTRGIEAVILNGLMAHGGILYDVEREHTMAARYYTYESRIQYSKTRLLRLMKIWLVCEAAFTYDSIF
jgi:hypothetical protein